MSYEFMDEVYWFNSGKIAQVFNPGIRLPTILSLGDWPILLLNSIIIFYFQHLIFYGIFDHVIAMTA
jgi:hypothetical protein